LINFKPHRNRAVFFYGEMMKLKTLSLALLAFSFVLSARADANAAQPNNVIAFNVEAERQIERDLMQVNLFYQSEGKNLSELNKTVNTRLNKAIGIAKQYPAVAIQGNTRNTMVQYDGKGKQSGWLARVELMLESKDSQALSDVINALDDTLAIENISASVSDEKLTHVENELTQAVLEKFKNKALLIQNTLQMKNYRVMDLNISAANEHNYARVYYEPTAKSALTLSESASNAVPLENGKETVRMRVEGRIELLSD
jgi:raw score 13.19